MSVELEVLDAAIGIKNASRTGDEVLCSCPMGQRGIGHSNGDAHPSCRINLEKEVYFCHGCGARGTLRGLLMDVLSIDRSQAASILHPDLTPDELERLLSRPEYVPVSKPKTIKACVDEWASNKVPYWQSRGFTEQTAGRWRLGYDPQENRAVVPVYMDRELIGWTKRKLSEDDQGPKWRNSPGFNKSEALFGIDEARGGRCVLVEAPLSAIKLWQDGVENAVASFGCSLSERQAEIIRSRFDECTVFYDPDEAGRSGTEKAVDALSPHMPVYVVQGHRDDPAAMETDENRSAVEFAVPHYMLDRGGESKSAPGNRRRVVR